MKKIAAVLLVFSFVVSTTIKAQVNRAITVIHCDPDDPDPTDGIPWPQDVSPITWNKLSQMVQYADSKNVKLTIEMTADWVDFVLNSPTSDRQDTVNAWQARGHEIAAHHHLFLHTYWDGYTNDPSQTNGQNGAVYIDATEVFYNQLRVLCSPYPLLTSGTGPAGSSKDTVAMEWSNGIIYQTTNKSGLKPENNGGRFTDEAFSNVTHDTLIDPIMGNQFEVCKLSYCFLENVDSVNTIISKSYIAPYSVVGGVIHPFNYSGNPIPFNTWIDSISTRFPGQCKTVSAVIQETNCNALVTSVSEKNSLPENNSLLVYPNPTSDKIYVRINSDTYQKTEAAIYDLQGNKIKVFYYSYLPKGSFVLESSISELAIGTYLVVVSGDKLNNFVKFIKE